LKRSRRKRPAIVPAALLALFLISLSAAAQVEPVVIAMVVEPDLLPVPVIHYIRIEPSDHRWRASIVGFMVGVEHQRPVRPQARLVTSLDLTPARANASDRIYERGELIESAEFTNRQFDLRVGFDYERSPRWTTSIRLIGMGNLVDHLPEELERYWRNPYAGVSIEQTYGRLTAIDPFRGTFEGPRFRALAEAYVGEKKETWSRALVTGEQGQAIKRIRLTQSATLFYGESLNPVNRFLVGSSWRMPGIHPLYGFRYGEFRIDKGAALNGALDYKVTDRVDAGLRLSYLTGSSDESGVKARGAALEAGTTMRGIGITLGAGLPRQRNATKDDLTFYAMVGTAVFLGDLSSPAKRSAAGRDQ
jgi:hypothetical protein